jgi:chloramphenicol 3-O phosphotransferase
MAAGRVILVNGASSAGKTSLLRAIQAIMPRPFLNAGIDLFVRMLPEHYVDTPLWPQVFGQMYRSGPLGHQLIRDMHHTIASLAV